MSRLIFFFIAALFTAGVSADERGSKSNPHVLVPSPTTIAWGHYHYKTPPVLRIKSGDWVSIRTLLVGSFERLKQWGIPEHEIEPALKEVEVITDRGPGPHKLTGPIYIDGAEPGDVLEVRIHAIDLLIDYGINVIGDLGFLSDEIPVRQAKVIRFDREKNVAMFTPGIEIPLKPFFGSMGVAPPKDAGRFHSAPPWIHAGNLDNQELIAGTTLFIPIHIKGALFQAGDGHAAQGNGEISLTAIETSLAGKLQLIVRKDMKLEWPRAETGTHIITMGTDEDLTRATRIAAHEMIKYLMQEKGLSQADAYSLTSVAVDLNITQLVDGKKGVHAMLPKSLFID